MVPYSVEIRVAAAKMVNATSQFGHWGCMWNQVTEISLLLSVAFHTSRTGLTTKFNSETMKIQPSRAGFMYLRTDISMSRFKR